MITACRAKVASNSRANIDETDLDDGVVKIPPQTFVWMDARASDFVLLWIKSGRKMRSGVHVSLHESFHCVHW